MKIWGKSFQAEGTAMAKALWQHYAWCPRSKWVSSELEPAKEGTGDWFGRADGGRGPPPRAWGQGKKLGVHSQKKGRLPEGSKWCVM